MDIYEIRKISVFVSGITPQKYIYIHIDGKRNNTENAQCPRGVVEGTKCLDTYDIFE